MKKKYPDLKYVKILEESFNDLYSPDRNIYELPKISLILCLDFTEIKDNYNVGVDAMSTISFALNSITPNADFFEFHRHIFTDKFCINCVEYCTGRVPYVSN